MDRVIAFVKRLRGTASPPPPKHPWQVMAERSTYHMLDLIHHQRLALVRQMPPCNGPLLSVGCAGTHYFVWFEERYGRVDEHIGIELYVPKPDDLPANVAWISNSAANMSAVADGYAGLIFSGQNIEHLWPDEVVDFLLEAWRVLRVGGHLVLDSPNRDITAALNWVMGEHTIEFTADEAKELLHLAGFDVTKTVGTWLCRDPRTSRLLPFDANVADPDWTPAERIICALDDPDRSFCWWIEAVRTSRAPDRAGLTEKMERLFASAWPERLQRFRVQLGTVDHRSDGDWVVCPTGTAGYALTGPFIPLRSGRYRVAFRLRANGGRDPAAAVARCDVVIANFPDPPLAIREVTAGDLTSGEEVALEFVLSKTEFYIEFRCFSYGTTGIDCKRQIALATLPQ